MEQQLWTALRAVLATLPQTRKPTICDFSDADIVKLYYWSVLHDRPVSWACDRRHWPMGPRRQTLPSSATMSRRLRTRSVRALLETLQQRVVAPAKPGLFWMIDGKPLPIGGCSKDRQAGYGRAARSKAKGYKLHALIGSEGAFAAWRVAPMNQDERVLAARMLKKAAIAGYVVADSNYDSNILHQICDTRGDVHLLTYRRQGAGHGLGHRKHADGRLRSIALTENPYPAFAQGLLHERDEIERRFGQLTNWGGSLTCLPAWVRTHRRVYRWVQAKLVLTALKRSCRKRSCAA